MRVAVVGGGFWGLVSALALARSGFNVLLLEEHRRVGIPEHCTGLVSRRVLDYIGPPVVSSVVTWYSRFKLCGPSSCMSIEPEGGVYKIDRVAVEERLREEAESEGVKVKLGVRVKSVEPSGSLVWQGGSGSFHAIVIAEGATGRLRRRLGIGYAGGFIYGVNTLVDGCQVEVNQGFTVLFHGEARGLFSWLVPLPGGLCIVGSGSRDPRQLPKALESGRRLLGIPGSPSISKSYGGPLPLDGPARRFRIGRIVVVGDAAGLVKPLTGGGLYPAAAFYREALKALREGDPASALMSAAERVAGILARQVRAARILRKNPWLVDCIVRAASASRLDDALRGLVDYDLHHKIPIKALTSAPLKSVGAGFRALAKCPGLVALLAGALLAGFLDGVNRRVEGALHGGFS